ncbi:hypothetical protein BESB_005290 [Besnoitia besnoiti]|uniref:RSC6/BAF60A-like with A SWIB domain, related protein n=1 Tax=Besnoitia besnoiti TaxID=94643 RepID=A0A2A9MI18_BESBE|nr:hypothetical protein BESB_005290 [Besnoitia besnoiti]PFH38188.1 hypothetical protein BESB_005290 [Besnoitia besnoiti]
MASVSLAPTPRVLNGAPEGPLGAAPPSQAGTSPASGVSRLPTSFAASRKTPPGAGIACAHSAGGGTAASGSRKGGASQSGGASAAKPAQNGQQGNAIAPTVDVPECVCQFCPELYSESMALGEMQRAMDEATEQLITSLRDTCYPCLQTSSRMTLPTLLSRRRLRVFVYNTHENQPPPYTSFDQHAPQPDEASAALSAATLAGAQQPGASAAGANSLNFLSAAAGGERSSAAASGGSAPGGEDGKKSGCMAPVESSEVHMPPPSWCLYIKAVSMEKQDTTGANCGCGPAAGLFTPRFSSFFSRVMILTPEEAVVWDSRTTSSLAASLFDGLSVHRKGSREMNLKILFFINYRTPTFRLSNALSTLCGGQQQLSLCGILRAIWLHVLAKNLLISDEKSEAAKSERKDGAPSTEPAGKTTVDPSGTVYARTDAALQAVFGSHVQQFCFADLPRLLRGHLMPPRPVCISHPLKLSGDWIDNEHTYEFTLECLDTAGAGWGAGGSASAPSANASLSSLFGNLSSLTGSAATSMALWSSAVETLLQNMTTSCCVLGLDPWLSSQQQVLQQLASQTQLQHLQQLPGLAASQSAGGGGGPPGAQKRCKAEEQTEKEQSLLHDILQVQQQTDELDAKLKNTMEKLQQRVMYRNLYEGFANDPLAFLNQQLSPTLPNISEALLDEDFLYDYHARQRTASYYTLPWVPRAVQRYLQKQSVPIEDQVCKVLSSFNIPDPRKRQREGVDGAAGTGQGPAGATSGLSSSSRSSKPRTGGGSGAANGGASSGHRPRPSGSSRHVKKKEESPQAPPGSSSTPGGASASAMPSATSGLPGSVPAPGGPPGAALDGAHPQATAGAVGPDHLPHGMPGRPPQGMPGGQGAGYVAPPGGMKGPASGGHFVPSPSPYAPMDPSVAMMSGMPPPHGLPAAGGAQASMSIGPGGQPAGAAGPYHRQAMGLVEASGVRPPMGMAGAPAGMYGHGSQGGPPMGGGLPVPQMMQPHGLMPGPAGGMQGPSWVGPQAQQTVGPHVGGPGHYWGGAPGMPPGGGLRPGGHMG